MPDGEEIDCEQSKRKEILDCLMMLNGF